MYANFDARYRPKPQRWRIALVSLCHFLLGVTITNAIVSVADVAVLRAAPGMPDRWIFFATPWLSLKPMLPRIVKAYDFRTPFFVATGGLLIAALVAAYLWPARQSIASRLWAVTLGQTLAAFGAAIFPFRGWETIDPLLYAAPVLAAVICMMGEWNATVLLGGYYDLNSPLQRIGMWMLRVVPGLALIGAASYGVRYMWGVYAAGGLAVVTLFANLIRRPARSLETMREVEMKEAAAALPFVTAVLIGAAAFFFGYSRPYGVVYSGGKLTHEPLAGAVKTIEPPKPVIDIHWSRRPRKP